MHVNWIGKQIDFHRFPRRLQALNVSLPILLTREKYNFVRFCELSVRGHLISAESSVQPTADGAAEPDGGRFLRYNFTTNVTSNQQLGLSFGLSTPENL